MDNIPTLKHHHFNWRELLLSSDLPSNSKLIALYLSTFMNDKQQLAWPSQARIIKETSLSNGTVNNHLAILAEKSWIKRERGNSRKTTRYIAILPKEYDAVLDRFNSGISNQTDTENHSLDTPPDGELKQLDTPPDGELTLHQVETNKPIINKPLFKKESKKKKAVSKWKVPDWINQGAWCEYEQHRVDIKKPMTDLARSKVVKKLEGLDPDKQQSVIDKTIENGWTGLFSVHGKANEASKTSSGRTSDEDYSGVETHEGFLAGLR